MLFFIPAWYKENTWREHEQFWYERRMRSEFDETIKQISLFHRNMSVPYRVLLLSYAPNFRHFLHRQGMLRASYWSCFDAMMQVTKKNAAVFSFHDLTWPTGVEFVYSPFLILVMKDGEKYAQIEFGEDGNPIAISMYEDNQICRLNHYDDRGFVGSTVIYHRGLPVYEDYLIENGIWKLREYKNDGHVEVNPNFSNYSLEFDGEVKEYPYKKGTYSNIEEVIDEVFLRYVSSTDEKDVFFTAMHPLHLQIITNALLNRRTIATFFESRLNFSDLQDEMDYLNHSDYIITDSNSTTQLIQMYLNCPDSKIRDISPYDARIDFGISQQLKVQNILIPIDGIADFELEKIVYEVFQYLTENDKAIANFFSRDGSYHFKSEFEKWLVAFAEKNGFKTSWILDRKNPLTCENKMEEDEDSEPRVLIDQFIDERSISKCIHEQRVILDMRNVTDVFLSITAISKGVPVISSSENQYMEHLQNGYLISDSCEIRNALHFYLDEMEHWNQALISNYEISKKFTTKVLIDSWREVLESFE